MSHSDLSAPLTDAVSEYSLGTTYEALPMPVVDFAKRLFVDTLGCTILGSTMPAGINAARYARALGGVEQSTVVGAGFKAPAGLAALVNGTSGHADELDAVHYTRGHLAVIALPVALALTESLHLDGKEFLNAFALAFDIGSNLLAALGGRQNLLKAYKTHSSAVYALGAAAAAGRLLQLSPMQFNHALALAMHNVSAPLALMDEREHMSKALTHGQAANAGITGALLAAAGVEANDRILDADNGVIGMWTTSKTDTSLLTAGLGEHYNVVDNGFKHFSCGYPIHAPLAGALQLMTEHSIATDDITRVRFGMTTSNADIVDNRAMPSICIQDMAALGMVLGRLGFEDAHDPANVERDDVRRLRSVIEVYRDPELDALPAPVVEAWTELETKSGAKVRIDHVLPRGNWALGGSPWDDVAEKFLGLATPRVGEKSARRLLEFGEDLENVTDMALLSPFLIGPSDL